MPEVESAYYHSLAGFEALFQTGRPILTFHKFGPRPRATRLKGLYLSEKLFSRQLAELAQAGYETSSLSNLGDGKGKRSIVLTIDDGFCNVVEYGLPLLTQYRAKAMLFLVADRLGQTNDWDIPQGEAPALLMTASQVRDWLAAGHEIGSHTLTHAWLTRVPIAQAREEISASKKKLEDLFGLPIRHFCYPYGDWNPAIRDLVVEAGYSTACTTDFGVNPPGADPFALKRITARYRSRNIKALRAWLKTRLGL